MSVEGLGGRRSKFPVPPSTVADFCFVSVQDPGPETPLTPTTDGSSSQSSTHRGGHLPGTTGGRLSPPLSSGFQLLLYVGEKFRKKASCHPMHPWRRFAQVFCLLILGNNQQRFVRVDFGFCLCLGLTGILNFYVSQPSFRL